MQFDGGGGGLGEVTPCCTSRSAMVRKSFTLHEIASADIVAAEEDDRGVDCFDNSADPEACGAQTSSFWELQVCLGEGGLRCGA